MKMHNALSRSQQDPNQLIQMVEQQFSSPSVIETKNRCKTLESDAMNKFSAFTSHHVSSNVSTSVATQPSVSNINSRNELPHSTKARILTSRQKSPQDQSEAAINGFFQAQPKILNKNSCNNLLQINKNQPNNRLSMNPEILNSKSSPRMWNENINNNNIINNSKEDVMPLSQFHSNVGNIKKNFAPHHCPSRSMDIQNEQFNLKKVPCSGPGGGMTGFIGYQENKIPQYNKENIEDNTKDLSNPNIYHQQYGKLMKNPKKLDLEIDQAFGTSNNNFNNQSNSNTIKVTPNSNNNLTYNQNQLIQVSQNSRQPQNVYSLNSSGCSPMGFNYTNQNQANFNNNFMSNTPNNVNFNLNTNSNNQIPRFQQFSGPSNMIQQSNSITNNNQRIIPQKDVNCEKRSNTNEGRTRNSDIQGTINCTKPEYDQQISQQTGKAVYHQHAQSINFDTMRNYQDNFTGNVQFQEAKFNPTKNRRNTNQLGDYHHHYSNNNFYNAGADAGPSRDGKLEFSPIEMVYFSKRSSSPSIIHSNPKTECFQDQKEKQFQIKLETDSTSLHAMSYLLRSHNSTENLSGTPNNLLNNRQDSFSNLNSQNKFGINVAPYNSNNSNSNSNYFSKGTTVNQSINTGAQKILTQKERGDLTQNFLSRDTTLNFGSHAQDISTIEKKSNNNSPQDISINYSEVRQLSVLTDQEKQFFEEKLFTLGEQGLNIRKISQDRELDEHLFKNLNNVNNMNNQNNAGKEHKQKTNNLEIEQQTENLEGKFNNSPLQSNSNGNNNSNKQRDNCREKTVPAFDESLFIEGSLREKVSQLENDNTMLQCQKKQLQSTIEMKNQMLLELQQQLKNSNLEQSQSIIENEKILQSYDTKIDSLVIQINKQKQFYEDKIQRIMQQHMQQFQGIRGNNHLLEKQLNFYQTNCEELQQSLQQSEKERAILDREKSMLSAQLFKMQSHIKRELRSNVSSVEFGKGLNQPHMSVFNSINNNMSTGGPLTTEPSVTQRQKHIRNLSFYDQTDDLTFINDLKAELQVESQNDLLLKIREMNNFDKEATKLIDCLTDMMINCAPKGYFEQKPSLQQIWKWLKNILQEYMNLKKYNGNFKSNQSSSDKELIDLIAQYLTIDNYNEIIPQLAKLVVDSQIMSRIVENVQELFGCSGFENLNELQLQIENEIQYKRQSFQ